MSENGYTDDAETMIEAWDQGDVVWSVEMGGLGPGYEQCIQVCAIEIMRALVAADLEWPDKDAVLTDELVEEIERLRDEAYKRIEGGGMTGAQVGAATNLAIRFVWLGPRLAVEGLDKDRRMMVSRHFPKAPPSPTPEDPGTE